MSQMIIVADLGRLRVLVEKEEFSPSGPRQHLAELSSEELDSKPQPIHDVVTDQQGRFGKGDGGQNPGAGIAENHQLESELENRSIKALAQRIDGVVADHAPSSWMLVAPADSSRSWAPIDTVAETDRSRSSSGAESQAPARRQTVMAPTWSHPKWARLANFDAPPGARGALS